jgi:enoyl-CoA hydratase/carnithine racemase
VTAQVHTERRGRVLVVTLDDPAHLNCYDGNGLKAIGAAWAELDADADLRVGVLTGAGREFCAGADVAAVAAGGFSDPPYPEIAEGLAAKPTLAAIEGRCLGGGVMIATGCDLRIGGASAVFGLPESRWNYPAQWLGALGRQIAVAHAMELALLGDERLSAGRLAEMGWLNRVVDDGTALGFALGWADRLAALAPGALRRFKELLRASGNLSPEDALALGHRHSMELMGMADTIEGGTAFAERRPPDFRDR